MPASSSAKRTVWIVDDDPIARLLIKKTLEREGRFQSYFEFNDGNELIQMLDKMKKGKNQEPDLILLDLNMPEKDGWDVLNYIKEKNISFQKGRLALLTSSINPNDRIKAATYKSVSGFFNKPLLEGDLQRLFR